MVEPGQLPAVLFVRGALKALNHHSPINTNFSLSRLGLLIDKFLKSPCTYNIASFDQTFHGHVFQSESCVFKSKTS